MAQAAEKTAVIPKVIVKKTVRAKRERVYDAWTKPELMQQWFFAPGWQAVTSNDLRVGGKYSHEMIGSAPSSCSSSVEASDDGKRRHLHTGEYLELTPPERLVFTWNSPSVRDTRVTVELRDLGESTEITITHELLGTEELRRGHTEGWEACMASLELYFAAGS